jgi:hypothetical protein
MNWKGFGRIQSCPNRDTIRTIAWRDYGNSRNIKHDIIPAENRTSHFQNMNLRRYRYSSSLGILYRISYNAVVVSLSDNTRV